MTSLTIKDLSLHTELDCRSMAVVHGGMGKTMPAFPWGPHASISATETSFNAAQMLGQSQNTVVNNGNNAAFVHGIHSHVHPTQSGTNTIHFG